MDTTRKFEKSDYAKDQAILVTGGSGFIGRRLTAKLAEQELPVVCMYHQRLPDPMAHVYPVCSDMSSAELIAAPLRGVKTVVHLAWENNFIGPSERLAASMLTEPSTRNLKILKNLIAAMEKSACRRIIFLSAVGASRHATSTFLQEKYLAELYILNSRISEKIILRSSLVCANGGANDRFLNSISKVMNFPAVYPVPKSKQQLSLIHVDDIAKQLARMATTEIDAEQAGSSIVEITGKESLKVEEIFKMVSTRMGKTAKIPLKGFIGNSLTPLFERDREKKAAQPRLRHFLVLGNEIDEKTKVENPLAKIKSENFKSVRESLTLPPSQEG